MKTISSTAVIKQGWEVFKKRWMDFYKLFLLVMVVSFFSDLAIELSADMFGSLGKALFSLLSYYIGIVLAIGYVRGYLRIVRKEKVELDVLYEHYQEWKTLFKFLVAQLIYSFVVAVGLVLLVIPGIYLMIKYAFVQTLIADKGLEIGEAFKKSAQMTDGVKWELLGFGMLLILMNIGGALLLGLGLVVTVPVSTLASAFIYEKLRK